MTPKQPAMRRECGGWAESTRVCDAAAAMYSELLMLEATQRRTKGDESFYISAALRLGFHQ